MSWGITVYAEKKRKGSDRWEFVGEILQEAKWCLVTDSDEGNYGYDMDIDGAFYEIDENELSEGLLKQYDGHIDNYHMVKTYPVSEMRRLCQERIDKYATSAMMCYKALGIRTEESNDTFSLLSTCGELDSKYTVSGDIRKNYNPLTFPVSKDLFIELNDRFDGMQRAAYWQGILATVDTLAEEDWELDRDCEIRLVFVRSC